MRKITLLITETYNSEGILSDRLDEMVVDVNNLPDVLLDLSDQASKILDQKNLVISFPDRNTETIMVEIYNGYRE